MPPQGRPLDRGGDEEKALVLGQRTKEKAKAARKKRQKLLVAAAEAAAAAAAAAARAKGLATAVGKGKGGKGKGGKRPRGKGKEGGGAKAAGCNGAGKGGAGKGAAGKGGGGAKKKKARLPTLVVGMRVGAYYLGDEAGGLYSGRIRKDNGDGTFAVKFDDGDVDKRVKAKHIDRSGGGGEEDEDDEDDDDEEDDDEDDDDDENVDQEGLPTPEAAFALEGHLPPHAVNVFLPLVDLTAANGGTEFYPTTHLLGRCVVAASAKCA